ncbi:MAG TPA: flagellar biosynthesis anti-sigma factor FlgM [Firmicutes bacterium]|nr:flagellar biosynthesis anti-sigma factor FlgM [Bacillota bacterium]
MEDNIFRFSLFAETAMRISEIIASLIPKVRPIGPGRDVGEVPASGKIYSRPDAVELSGEGQILSRLASEIKKLPEIDEAKVAELRAKIEAGEYNPDSKAVAAKILGIDQD